MSLRLTAALIALALLSPAAALAAPSSAEHQALLANRITWGATPADLRAIAAMGETAWLKAQLHPPAQDRLPAPVQAQIDALAVSRTSVADLGVETQARRKAALDLPDADQKLEALKAAKRAEREIQLEAASRSLLRDVYSPDQLKEQMTWFWLNHFNVFAAKKHIRVLVGDFEDSAIRPHALGRFRDLLEATLRHPAMLRYLDNDDNGVGKINENYAREIMELHTLGVGSGYTQKDVQELARILTGVGVNFSGQVPRGRPGVVADGLLLFNPNRHDFGDKLFLGHVIRGSGWPEVEQALDILSRQPATARHVSARLAVYFVGDQPPPALVERMAAAFQRTDGDIAAVLQTLFASPEFDASLGKAFKDPMHYVVSALRTSFPDRVITDTRPVQGWLHGLGEGLFEHDTPDGYPLASDPWKASGGMTARFEVARRIGAGAPGLFGTPADPSAAAAEPAAAQLQDAAFVPGQGVSAATAAVLGEAGSPAERNALWLSSPEFMRR